MTMVMMMMVIIITMQIRASEDDDDNHNDVHDPHRLVIVSERVMIPIMMIIMSINIAMQIQASHMMMAVIMTPRLRACYFMISTMIIMIIIMTMPV